MDRYLVVLLLLGAPLPAAAQQPQPAQPQLASLQGAVINSATGEGFRKAFVRLTAKGNSYPAQTDDHGAFSIQGIVPGTYSLFAERQGFVAPSDDDSQRITLTAGQSLTSVQIKLIPQAVITGRIVDEDGDPWTHGYINVFRSIWKDGRRQVDACCEGGDVDDLGEFRVYALSPGSYYLKAEVHRQWEVENTPRTGPSVTMRQGTWYSSSLDTAGATPVVVRPGDQVSGIEIRLRRESVHHIVGSLIGHDTVPQAPLDSPFTGRAIQANGLFGKIRADGSFEIPNVPPGSYDVRVTQDYPPLTLGTAQVQIADHDVDNLSIQLSPPRTIRGIIQVQDGNAIPAGLKVFLDDVTSDGIETAAVSNADGTFEFARVGLGRHRIVVKAGNGAFLKQIRLGDTLSADVTISLPGSDGPLLLVLSSRGAHLAGLVTVPANQQPGQQTRPDQHSDQSPACKVVLLPSDPALGPARVTTLDQNSVYAFDEMLPPGSYKLYAFESIPDGLWDDPQFINEISSKGAAVKLGETESQRVDVPLISKSELAPTLQKLGVD